MLESPGRPPTDSQASDSLALLDDLPALTEKAKRYLVEHEDLSRLSGGGEFEPFGLEPESHSTFILELTHPADEDGVYRVQFQNGNPVSSGRDD